MGVAVSNWRLANAVACRGQLGVVSGTFIDTVLARRLQDGDPSGDMRRAIKHFPVPHVARQVLRNYFIDGGKQPGSAYKAVPMHSLNSPRALLDLTVVANFVEVFLAKENNNGPVGINYLTKIDLPTLPSLYGAMLAGVDFVLMGAGIPKAIPSILERLSEHRPVSLKIDVVDAGPDDLYETRFDPGYYGLEGGSIHKPNFVPIVSSSTLAQSLLKKCPGQIAGFVVEHHTAGGHNAPPRGGITVDENGEPIYTLRDEPEMERFAQFDVPFWIAGSSGRPERLKAALEVGAQGIQVGTAFAFCLESGIADSYKQRVIEAVLRADATVFTDPRASSSGYPFKIVQLEGTASDDDAYKLRPRVCDLGYLRVAAKGQGGDVKFRCPAEPLEQYLAKGGRAEETIGRKCLCNGLLSTVDMPQVRNGYVEPALVTAGSDIQSISQFLGDGESSYTASCVLDVLLGERQARDASRHAGGHLKESSRATSIQAIS
jgi:nitronate monooxygenase